MENNTPIDLEDEVTKWKLQYGKKKRADNENAAPYYKIEPSERLDLLILLVRKIRALGKPKEYFTGATKDRIVLMCIPPKGSVQPKTYEGYLKGTREHLNLAVCAVFDAKEIENREEIEKTPDFYKEKELEVFVPEPSTEEKDYVFNDDMSDLLGIK